MSTTVADLVTIALKRINVLQANETPSADDSRDAFQRLNAMLGSWRLRRLTIPFLTRATFTISSSKGTLASPYTVGTGGDVNIARPPLPNDLTVRYQDTSVSPTFEYRLTLLTDDAWALIPQKNLTAPLPSCSYYNPTYAGSLGSLYLYPVPTNSNQQGVVYAPTGLPDYAALTDTVVVPDGYTLAITDNLALLLWPEWREGSPVDPTLALSAREALDALMTANLRMSDLSVDPAVLRQRAGRYSIQSDGPA